MEVIDVLDHSVGKQIAAQIMDLLAHVYHDRAIWIGLKALRLDARIDLGPLPQPVLADPMSRRLKAS